MAAIRVYQLNHRKRPVERLFRPRLGLEDIRDVDLISRYRLDRHGIEYLHDLLNHDLSRHCNRSIPITPMTQILVSLRYLAKGELFSEVGDIHGVSRSSVSRILSSFIDSINVNLDNIRFPTDLNDIKLSFYKKCGLPNVVGAVDGTLIPIIAPVEHEEVYVCRKGFHALNVQAVVDHEMRFIDVVSKWPGSTHDASIFDGCGLKEYLADNNVGHLLGDSGYPLKEYLMTPFLRPTTDAEIQYNAAHSKGRVIIERSFGVLKSRFRCLHKTGGCLPFSPSKCGKIVTACMRLHNLCRERGIPLATNEVIDDDDHDDSIQPSQACDGSGQRKRQALLRLFE